MATSYAYGATVTKGTTASGERFSGEIFAYDDAAKLLVVRTPGEISNSYDLKFINVAGAKDVEIDASTAKDPEALPNRGTILAASAASRRRAERRKTAGDNIGEKRQRVGAGPCFDALARTLPCRWNKDVIVVHG